MLNSELEFENKLIDVLTNGESQWVLRDDIRTEEDVWKNIRKKINHNNTDKLGEDLLTDQEFERIKEQMSFSSFYEAGRWLVGENGHVTVEIQRDQHRLRLSVLNQNEIAGGTSSYEVIHQLKVDKRLPNHRDRRLDVTLLFNGLPLIHIELKGPRTSRKEAFNQINKYINEGIFRGPLSMIQMFVVMNEGGAQYIAAPRKGQLLNPKFLTGWIDADNQPISGGLNFAKEVLSIPQAHHMISDYMVLDNLSSSLILLRPYQIQAIQKVQESSAQGKSGFIWHTTGSGKTLTSYKVARNLFKIPSVEKTIFLVDRKDLDDQTFTAFDAYSENDILDVKGTDHTGELIKRLLSNDRSVIVTTRQKLNNIIKQVDEGKLSEDKVHKLRQRKIAFVVDECHRTISAEKQREIKRFFRESLWYGFTGTPIFSENKKQVKGNLAATTSEQYGDCLHRYTVKEAIHDNAVLGFKMNYQTTIDEEDVVEIVAQSNPQIASTNDQAEMEALIPKQYFENDAHRLKVIDAIINKSRKNFGMTRDSGKKNGEFYEAILTTSSIKEAQRYYELFQEVIRGESPVEISSKTKLYAPDFPKVAITYSVSENEDDSIVNQEKFQSALDDYNAMFGTNWGLDNIGAYNKDLNSRLARKKERYLNRDEQLDIVIVVDRLLTGFDAPCISTLFIDRAPQTPQDLIQAFSRTNRIFDKGKPYGNVTIFRTPALFKEHVDNALRLYSSGGEESVLAPTWEETEQSFIEATRNLLSLVRTPEEVMALSSTQKKQFVSRLQALNRAYENLIVYDEYEDKELADYGITLEQIEGFQIMYQEVLEELKQEVDDDKDMELLDIEYELNMIHSEEIGYEYILNLMQSLVAQKDQLQLIDDNLKQEVNEYLEKLAAEKPDLAQSINDIWETIQNDPYQYADQDIRSVLEEKIAEKEKEYIQNFANDWEVNEEDVRYAVDFYDKENDSRELNDLAKQASKQNKISGKRDLNSLKIRKKIKDDFKTMMSQFIEKLR